MVFAVVLSESVGRGTGGLAGLLCREGQDGVVLLRCRAEWGGVGVGNRMEGTLGCRLKLLSSDLTTRIEKRKNLIEKL